MVQEWDSSAIEERKWRKLLRNGENRCQNGFFELDGEKCDKMRKYHDIMVLLSLL